MQNDLVPNIKAKALYHQHMGVDDDGDIAGMTDQAAGIGGAAEMAVAGERVEIAHLLQRQVHKRNLSSQSENTT